MDCNSVAYSLGELGHLELQNRHLLNPVSKQTALALSIHEIHGIHGLLCFPCYCGQTYGHLGVRRD